MTSAAPSIFLCMISSGLNAHRAHSGPAAQCEIRPPGQTYRSSRVDSRTNKMCTALKALKRGVWFKVPPVLTQCCWRRPAVQAPARRERHTAAVPAECLPWSPSLLATCRNCDAREIVGRGAGWLLEPVHVYEAVSGRLSTVRRQPR